MGGHFSPFNIQGLKRDLYLTLGFEPLPPPGPILHTNDFFFTFSLQVREIVSECQCPTQFPMIRVSEGKYRIGDTQTLIFVRVSERRKILNFTNIFSIENT